MLDRCFTFILSYPSSTVAAILQELSPRENAVVLDPFCGTGTTLLECKRRGIASIGIDANPVCVLATRVKTNWGVGITSIERELTRVLHESRTEYRRFDRARREAKIKGRYLHPTEWPSFARSPRGRYLESSGLLQRNWISPTPALKALILAEEIARCEHPPARNLLLLALLGLLVPEFSNLKYGPELYCNRRRMDAEVFDVFEDRVAELLDSIVAHRQGFPGSTCKSFLGNTIDGGLSRLSTASVSHVITSPPYPAEHDYTRMTRLELVFGGFVASANDLVRIKRAMIPSSSKNCYVDQPYYNSVKRFATVRDLRGTIYTESRSRTHGFARVYPRLVGDYFGAMYEHLRRLRRCLKPGATCAYIVGDQSSFFGIHIQTALVLRRLLKSQKVGLEFLRSEVLKKNRPTARTRNIPEIVMYFRKPRR